MKHNYFVRLITLLYVSVSASLFHSCTDENNEENWVDLRYRVEDSYEVPAVAPEKISFLVKSTKPWEVFGNEDWYEISPAHGDAGETVTVEISCSDNTGLDDRKDTISIKSDYWVGKQFTILQKGTAYLNVEDTDINIPAEGGSASFKVLSNQKWTSKVAGDTKWLSIKSGNEGELNGKIEVEASVNEGMQRIGIIEIYDRHGVVVQSVECCQGGIVLSPQQPENGKWFALESKEQTFEISVESNTEWIVEKENADEQWFDVTKDNGKIILSVQKNSGKAVRIGTVLVKSADASQNITIKVEFRQINERYTEEYTVNDQYEIGTHTIQNGLLPGKSTFYFNGGAVPNTADVTILAQWKWGTASTDVCRIESRIRNGYAQGITSPWNNKYNYANATGGTKLSLDTDFNLGFEFEKYTEVVPNIANAKWYVNEQNVADIYGSGGKYSDPVILWEKVFSPSGVLQIKVVGSPVTMYKWTYSPVLVWDK